MSQGLSPDQKKFYQDNGYILVKGLFTKEDSAMYRKECHDLATRLQKIRDIDATWSSVRAPEKKTVILHCHDVQFYSAAFSRLIVDPRFTACAQSICGENVQLHHTKMFIKPPEKGSPFPMHQDTPYFPHEKHSMFAAIIHFDDAPLEKGCVRVYPGSHKLGWIKDVRPGDNSLSPEKYPLEKATACPAEAGDVLFFSYLTIHGSGINTSNEARTTVLVQMRDPSDPPTIRTHESRGQGMMLAGIDPTCCTKPWTEEEKSNGSAVGGSMGAPVPAMGKM